VQSYQWQTRQGLSGKNLTACPDTFEVTNMATYELVRNINHPEYHQ
jgi:hypothetical protein